MKLPFICFKESPFSVLLLSTLLSLMSLYVYAEVRVTSIEAAHFGLWTSGDLIQQNIVCVHNSRNKKYSVSAHDNSTITTQGFFLENSTHTVQIPFQIYWNNQASDGGKLLIEHSPINRVGADNNDELCTLSGPNANLQIVIQDADIEASPSGIYSSEINLLIEPR